ncbi:hypothetical protein SLE2022_206300 [Rubroshorea leprosula]
MQETPVIVVGAGPSGLATAACLNIQSIPYILLEREDRFASLWTKYSYDCLHIHLPKQISTLPHMPFPANFPTYVSKDQFVQYLQSYISQFNITPLYRRCVEEASFDEGSRKWVVKARNLSSGEVEEYLGRFLVVASGETSDPYTPEVEGLDTFRGHVFHSTLYKNGKGYSGKNVLVVGAGNSGMEVAMDLANHGAITSIVARSPVQVVSKRMIYLALVLLRYFPLGPVDSLMVMLSKLVYGDLTKYGLSRPKEGPLFIKVACGKYPIVDMGAISKIKSGEIQVLPAISSISGNEVLFENGKAHSFDTIVFCTGFRPSTNKWLKGGDHLLNEEGIAKNSFPNNWKGKNGLYCTGLSRTGFKGASFDAQSIASDIKSLL